MATLACTYSRTEIEIITYLFPNATLQCHEYLLFDLLIRRGSGFSKSFCHLQNDYKQTEDQYML